MIMTMSIAEAIKYVRALSRRHKEVELDEQQRRTVLQVGDTVITPTEYDFGATQMKLGIITDNIISAKHAINVANATETISEIGMTADKVLVKMSALTNRLVTLRSMMTESEYRTKSTEGMNIVLLHRNFDVADVRKAERSLSDELANLQSALDRHNMSFMIEFQAEAIPDDTN